MIADGDWYFVLLYHIRPMFDNRPVWSTHDRIQAMPVMWRRE